MNAGKEAYPKITIPADLRKCKMDLLASLKQPDASDCTQLEQNFCVLLKKFLLTKAYSATGPSSLFQRTVHLFAFNVTKNI